MLHFTHLVMSGGGFTALAYFGALRLLRVEGMDAGIRNVSGTSMGAIFAAAFALRIPMDVLEERLLAFLQDEERNRIPYPDLVRAYQELGMQIPVGFLDVLRPEIDHMTFLALSKKTGVHLVICATHIPTFQPTYFSVDSTPHVLVADAVRASCAIPWIFKPVSIGNDLYVDGAVTDNIPFTPFKDVASNSLLVFHVTEPAPTVQDLEPMSYTIALMSRFFSQLNFVPYMRIRFPFYVLFDACPLPFVSFALLPEVLRWKITKEQLESAVAYGYESTYNALRPFMQKGSWQT